MNIASKDRLMRHLESYEYLADGIIELRQQRHFKDNEDFTSRLNGWVEEQNKRRGDGGVVSSSDSTSERRIEQDGNPNGEGTDRGDASGSRSNKKLATLTTALSRKNSSVANERFIF